MTQPTVSSTEGQQLVSPPDKGQSHQAKPSIWLRIARSGGYWLQVARDDNGDDTNTVFTDELSMFSY